MDQRGVPYQRGAPHRAITRQFLSPYIPLLLNNFFNRIHLALWEQGLQHLTTRRKATPPVGIVFCSSKYTN